MATLTNAEQECWNEMQIRNGRASRPTHMPQLIKTAGKFLAITAGIYVLGFAGWITLGIACMEDGNSTQECSETYLSQGAQKIYSPVIAMIPSAV